MTGWPSAKMIFFLLKIYWTYHMPARLYFILHLCTTWLRFYGLSANVSDKGLFYGLLMHQPPDINGQAHSLFSYFTFLPPTSLIFSLFSFTKWDMTDEIFGGKWQLKYLLKSFLWCFHFWGGKWCCSLCRHSYVRLRISCSARIKDERRRRKKQTTRPAIV